MVKPFAGVDGQVQNARVKAVSAGETQGHFGWLIAAACPTI
jgi:hypothetical protein